MTTYRTGQPNDQKAEQLRLKMVCDQLEKRDIHDINVLNAMRKVPRHLFGKFTTLEEAYGDFPYHIDCQQTISQPYMVAFMTQALEIEPFHKVLEIGTGSGYQTAILCELSSKIYSIERHAALSQQAQSQLESLGYHPRKLIIGDGSQGLSQDSPFDRILVTAACDVYPQNLIQQLNPDGGIIIFPIDTGKAYQRLLKVIRHSLDQTEEIDLGEVRFVPLIRAEAQANSQNANPSD